MVNCLKEVSTLKDKRDKKLEGKIQHGGLNLKDLLFSEDEGKKRKNKKELKEEEDFEQFMKTFNKGKKIQKISENQMGEKVVEKIEMIKV